MKKTFFEDCTKKNTIFSKNVLHIMEMSCILNLAVTLIA